MKIENASFRTFAVILVSAAIISQAGLSDTVFVDKPRRTVVVGYSEDSGGRETVTFKYCRVVKTASPTYDRTCEALLLPNKLPQQILWKMVDFEIFLGELKMASQEVESILTDLLENAPGQPSVDYKVKAETNPGTKALMETVARKRLELLAKVEKEENKPAPQPKTNPNAGKILSDTVTVGDHFNEHNSSSSLRFELAGEIHRRLQARCGWHNQYRILDQKDSYPRDNNPFSTGLVIQAQITFECL